MLEYPGFCYLDVAKTGSTFIRRFLLRNVAGKPVASTKHRRPGFAFRQRKFYFASVRDPLDSYASLYRFGCDGRGALREVLEARAPHLAETYDGTQAGFEAWLGIILDPATPPRHLGISRDVARWNVGLMGARFLSLALPGAVAFAGPGRDPARSYARWGLPRALIRQERLREDLAALVRGPLSAAFDDPPAVVARLESGKKVVNPSRTAFAIRPEALPEPLRRRLVAREWLHFGALGYRPYL